MLPFLSCGLAFLSPPIHSCDEATTICQLALHPLLVPATPGSQLTCCCHRRVSPLIPHTIPLPLPQQASSATKAPSLPPSPPTRPCVPLPTSPGRHASPYR